MPLTPHEPAVVSAESAPTTSEEHRMRGAEVVLVADDDDAVRAVMGLGLRARGYTVLEAGSAAEALAIARDHPGPIDLVISDVLMTGSGTGAFFGALRDAQPAIRTLSVSGYVPEEDWFGRREGPFLAKPFSPLALVVEVRRVLDAADPAPGSSCPVSAARV